MNPNIFSSVKLDFLSMTLLWICGLLIIIIGTFFSKKVFLNIDNEDVIDNRKNLIKKTSYSLLCLITAVYFIIIIIIAFFLKNDNTTIIKLNNSSPQIQNKVPSNFTPPSTSEIDKSNKSVNRKSIEIDKKAQKENNKAMQDSIKLFRNIKNNN